MSRLDEIKTRLQCEDDSCALDDIAFLLEEVERLRDIIRENNG